jgi:hypothetical protein
MTWSRRVISLAMMRAAPRDVVAPGLAAFGDDKGWVGSAKLFDNARFVIHKPLLSGA